MRRQKAQVVAGRKMRLISFVVASWFVQHATAFSSAASFLLRSPVRSRCARLEAAEGANKEDEEADPKELESLAVWNMKKKMIRDNRDTLPYHVDITSPPPQRLGVFNMDKNTASGDLLEHKLRMFEVQRVRCLYKYRSGRGFEMVKKVAEVKKATRVLEEAYLNRVMKIEATQEATGTGGGEPGGEPSGADGA